ncbi:D-3-phosphoglycerate dehydrogenase [Microthyrium microscopicum]|uniref:D-3-phosphoglycerate dehydrogenase n=1 Tax=Microthyrium microscopicum TaxID=703497 RepID=A0A6A6UPN0_9PEZI|nr:D-3-phosphoglycerate dehydrogenase [Microthyrium microscopicum]
MGGGPTNEKILCLLPGPEPIEIIERIRARYPKAEVTYVSRAFGTNNSDLSPDLFKDKTILFTTAVLPSEPSAAPHLKYVHLFSAGVDRILKHPLFLESNIPFSNCSGVHGPQISEWVIMTLLIHGHKYLPMYDAQKERKWSRNFSNGTRDLVGQRIGILGYGAIGRQVAHITKAMGMEVLAYTATPKDTPESRADHGYFVPGIGDPDGSIPSEWFSGLDKPSLHKFLSQNLDVLIVSVPLTPDTHHFLSSAEFDILGKNPPLISNIARGPIIDQPALIKALEDGRVGSAALDVTDPEPLPADDPLWVAPNTIITPHISGASTAYIERAFQVFERNLENIEKGQPLINIISRKKGY